MTLKYTAGIEFKRFVKERKLRGEYRLGSPDLTTSWMRNEGLKPNENEIRFNESTRGTTQKKKKRNPPRKQADEKRPHIPLLDTETTSTPPPSLIL